MNKVLIDKFTKTIEDVLRTKKEATFQIDFITYHISPNSDNKYVFEGNINFSPDSVGGNYLSALVYKNEEIPFYFDKKIKDAIENRKVNIMFNVKLKPAYEVLQKLSKKYGLKVITSFDKFIKEKKEIEVVYKDVKVLVNLKNLIILSVIWVEPFEEFLEKSIKGAILEK